MTSVYTTTKHDSDLPSRFYAGIALALIAIKSIDCQLETVHNDAVTTKTTVCYRD